MLSLAVLWIGVFTYLLFGVMCFLSLALGSDLTGTQLFDSFNLEEPNVTLEAFSMYGGMQIGLGLFYLLGIVKPRLREAVLWVLVLVPGMLFLTRSYALLTTAGMLPPFQYTALCVEGVTALLAVLALKFEYPKAEA